MGVGVWSMHQPDYCDSSFLVFNQPNQGCLGEGAGREGGREGGGQGGRRAEWRGAGWEGARTIGWHFSTMIESRGGGGLRDGPSVQCRLQSTSTLCYALCTVHYTVTWALYTVHYTERMQQKTRFRDCIIYYWTHKELSTKYSRRKQNTGF